MDKKSFSVERRDYVSPQVIPFSFEGEGPLAGSYGEPGSAGADGIFNIEEEEDY